MGLLPSTYAVVEERRRNPYGERDAMEKSTEREIAFY